QVASLGSLYPILQLLTGADGSMQAVRAGAFGAVLTYLGADVTLVNLLVLFLIVGFSYSALNLAADAYQCLHLLNLEVAVRTELFVSIVSSYSVYAGRLMNFDIILLIARTGQQ